MSRAAITGHARRPRQIDSDPDSDVRAAAAQAGRGPHETRLRELARSLLSLRIVHVVLLASVSSMPACVVPVAPTFQDPIGEPNVPPYIVSAIPSVGFVASATQMFQVTVTDQNVGDTLNYQWLIDYPPYNGDTRPGDIGSIAPSANGTQQQVTRPLLRLPCSYNPAPKAVHQLQFILADREFDPSNSTVPDALPPKSDGFVVRASWTFSCP
jgi:hypothetical protein